MRINVRVTANARAPLVVKGTNQEYNVKVDAPAVEGKANLRLIEILAKHFNVSKSGVRVLKGLKSRNKIIEIGEIELNSK